jgi:hypothetical protein
VEEMLEPLPLAGYMAEEKHCVVSCHHSVLMMTRRSHNTCRTCLCVVLCFHLPNPRYVPKGRGLLMVTSNPVCTVVVPSGICNDTSSS